MNNFEKKKGSITLSRSLLDSVDEKAFRALFTEFYPVNIQLSLFSFRGDLDYFGYSNHFREIEEGERVPKYEAIVRRKDGYNVDTGIEFVVEFKEVK